MKPYETTFEIKSNSGDFLSEIDIEVNFTYSHSEQEYYPDKVFGFTYDKKNKKYITCDLPEYLVEPIQDWLLDHKFNDVEEYIQEQENFI